MASLGDDDLVASKTEGYKVGEKKTVEEYAKLDQNDESLNRWKASLGIATGAPLAVTPGDTRRCVIQSLALEVESRPDIVIDLTAPGSIEALRSKPFIIKEGAKFRMKANFKVQHDVLSGLKYLQVVKRKGIRVGKDEEMLVRVFEKTLGTVCCADIWFAQGSYPPNTVDKPSYEKKFSQDEAPTGMMARGHYEAVSKFIDDDDHTHLKFEWSFDITKEWK
ncbi:hypothetical protein MMC15_004297 [Xylographa vitiligo]|nr:hypothetical protein [Xylographa vitiligo]